MEPESGLCRGCYRTIDEIAAWSGLSEAERDRILERIPQRKSSASATDVATARLMKKPRSG